jgi:hypothetical protein
VVANAKLSDNRHQTSIGLAFSEWPNIVRKFTFWKFVPALLDGRDDLLCPVNPLNAVNQTFDVGPDHKNA